MLEIKIAEDVCVKLSPPRKKYLTPLMLIPDSFWFDPVNVAVEVSLKDFNTVLSAAAGYPFCKSWNKKSPLTFCSDCIFSSGQ